jgi:transposase
MTRINRIHGYEAIRKNSRNKFTLDKFRNLIHLAQNTIGTCDEFYEIQLDIYLEMIDKLDEHISSIEKIIKNTMIQIDSSTSSIKGIGELSAAVITAEFGNFHNFDNPGQLLAFA